MTEKFSLLYPEGKEPAFNTLNDDTCNDLSLEYICEHIAESEYEQNVIKRMMMKLESDPEVIRYRCDIFEDILKFPSLRNKIKELLEQLDYLRELEKSVKDNTAAPVWQLINRLHELAMELDVMNSLEGELKAASLITGIHEGQRSYKVFIAPPEGVSYAKDIAEKYGVTFDQLKKSIKK